MNHIFPKLQHLIKEAQVWCFRYSKVWQQKQINQCRVDIQELNNKQKLFGSGFFFFFSLLFQERTAFLSLALFYSTEIIWSYFETDIIEVDALSNQYCIAGSEFFLVTYFMIGLSIFTDQFYEFLKGDISLFIWFLIQTHCQIIFVWPRKFGLALTTI